MNFLTLVTEFAAIDLALTKMGFDPRLGVPLVAAGLVVMAVTGSYRRWERTVVVLCLLDLTWFAIAFWVRPPIAQIAHGSLVPGLPPAIEWPQRMKGPRSPAAARAFPASPSPSPAA